MLDRDETDYDFRLRLTPRSQKLVEYSPEFDNLVVNEPKVKEEQVTKANTVVDDKSASGRSGRGRGSRTKTLKISRPNVLSSRFLHQLLDQIIGKLVILVSF